MEPPAVLFRDPSALFRAIGILNACLKELLHSLWWTTTLSKSSMELFRIHSLPTLELSLVESLRFKDMLVLVSISMVPMVLYLFRTRRLGISQALDSLSQLQ